MPKILIVEDDAPIRRFLRISFEANGFAVSECRLAEDCLSECASDPPDVMILDLGLPDMDGQEVIRRVREWSTVPIIVLSARSDAAEKVEALDAGANDYVTKPFSITELMARLRVMLRTASASDAENPAEYRCGDLEVDLAKRRIFQAGKELHVSRKEYELLRLLMTHAGQVLTHQQILREIWGPAHVSDIHYLRVLVGNLRQKLGDEPSRPHYIHTVQGVGYRLSD
jgi:two-component system KDP operon response regulator KdpE